CVSSQKSEDQVDRGSLARPIGAEQGKNLAWPDHKIQAIERGLVAKALHGTGDLENRQGQATTSDGQALVPGMSCNADRNGIIPPQPTRHDRSHRSTPGGPARSVGGFAERVCVPSPIQRAAPTASHYRSTEDRLESHPLGSRC